MKKIKFNHRAPFKAASGEVITMKSLATMHGIQSVECYENNNRYSPESLTPMSQEEYENYLDEECRM